MANFDIPNPEELQPYKVYNYDLVPEEYPIEQNRSTNTYDQFIMLRDTLVYSRKYYKGKAGAKLVIGEREETVEVELPNRFIQKMNPNRRSGLKEDFFQSLDGPYVEFLPTDLVSTFGMLSCVIGKDGLYRVQHKEEVISIPDDAIKIYSYVEHYSIQADGTFPTDPNTHEILPGNPIAVFDRECNKTITGSTSGTDPNGSCSITLTMGKLFDKMTAYGIIQTNLKRGDILALRMVYKSKNDNQFHDLILQDNRSNRWSVEYINLPLNIEN